MTAYESKIRIAQEKALEHSDDFLDVGDDGAQTHRVHRAGHGPLTH